MGYCGTECRNTQRFLGRKKGNIRRLRISEAFLVRFSRASRPLLARFPAQPPAL
jgi:hypothetical protein